MLLPRPGAAQGGITLGIAGHPLCNEAIPVSREVQGPLLLPWLKRGWQEREMVLIWLKLCKDKEQGRELRHMGMLSTGVSSAGHPRQDFCPQSPALQQNTDREEAGGWGRVPSLPEGQKASGGDTPSLLGLPGNAVSRYIPREGCVGEGRKTKAAFAQSK